MKRAEFVAAYAAQLEHAVQAHPEQYARGIDAMLTAERMTIAIEGNTFSHDAPALKALLRQYGVKQYSRKAVREWYAANIEGASANG